MKSYYGNYKDRKCKPNYYNYNKRDKNRKELAIIRDNKRILRLERRVLIKNRIES